MHQGCIRPLFFQACARSHAQLVRIIQDHRAKHGAPDQVMQKQYDIEHQKLMQKAAKSKAKLEIYKKQA